MLEYLSFYGYRGIEIERASLQYVWDKSGRRYVDCHTGHGVAFLGHCNPYIVSEVVEQMRFVAVASTSFKVRVRDEMINTLARITPSHLEYVTLLNSGSEAVELALKLARKATGRKSFTALTKSFHGRTMGALSVTWNPRYRKPFEPLVGDVRFIKFNEEGDVDEKIREDTAAVIIEVVQGEGGVNVMEKSFAKAVEERAREVGALLIIDEVQTGFGRTGSVWAHEKYGLKPDIMTAGKAMGGGFPVSAVFLTREVASKIEPGDHGSTFGGNPVACAAVKASVRVLRQHSVPEKADSRGAELLEALRNRLRSYRIVRDVRGLGLMIGVELRIQPDSIIKCLQDNGVLALKAGATVVRLLPPYMISRDDIKVIVDAVSKCIGEANERVVEATA